MRLTPGAGLRAVKRFIQRPRRPAPRAERRIVGRFHKLYYYARRQTWENTFWLDVPAAKCPLDLWIYQEIICQTKPDVIIETGTAHGGSALFLSSICDLLNRGRIITIDVKEQERRPVHPRIRYVTGSSVDAEIAARIRALLGPEESVMAILDSDHSAAHVLRELEIYAPLVTKGNYLIVEDTNVNSHPVLPLYGDGPMEAVAQFLNGHADFVADRGREKFFMTFNPGGYLLKVR